MPIHRAFPCLATVAWLVFAGVSAAAPGSDPQKTISTVRELVEDGRYEAAGEMARALVDELERMRKPDPKLEVRALIALVSALDAQAKARYPETRELAERSLRLAKKRLGKNDPNRIRAHWHMAVDRHDLARGVRRTSTSRPSACAGSPTS